MATFATQRLVELIETKTKAKCLSLSGNVCTDKKPAFINSVLGRGRQVWAETEIPTKTLQAVLKTTPEKLIQTTQAKLTGGGLVAGSLGANAQVANIAAALYLATGQDPAQVVEASQAVTQVQLTVRGVRLSVHLPAVLVGTVGGGTNLSAQKEALGILGLNRGLAGEADWLAAVVGGAALAGELSLLAALSSSHLCQAHRQLGRKGQK